MPKQDLPEKLYIRRDYPQFTVSEVKYIDDTEYVRVDIAYLEALRGVWISVEDELPQTDQLVLACGHVITNESVELESPHYSLVRICRYEGAVYSYKDEVIEWFVPESKFIDHEMRGVTHWRPIYTPEGIEL